MKGKGHLEDMGVGRKVVLKYIYLQLCTSLKVRVASVEV
jgi:hypothetical protein